MKNHAFLIIAHKQPKLLARTLSVLEASNHHFFINVDAKSSCFSEFYALIGGGKIQNVHFLKKRVACYWAGISLVDVEIELMKDAKSNPVHFDYYHLISGLDYPLRSNEQFDTFFESTEDSFMCFNFEKDIDYWMPIYKMKTNLFHTNGTHSLGERLFLKVVNNRFSRRIIKRTPIPDLAGGWQWFSWSANVVDYVLNYLKNNSGFRRRFNHTSSPDEHFFATMLYAHLDELHIRKHFPLRYVSWEPYREIEQKHRPYDLNEQDYERVIKSASFFCRKVDEVTSAKFLDMVDAQRGNMYDITEHDYFF